MYNKFMLYENNKTVIEERLQKLSMSIFRNKFHLGFKDVVYIKEKGLETIKKHAYELLEKRLVPKIIENDGKQTPLKGHPVFVAQHATATCCRDCLKKWHHIKKDKTLSQYELDYVVEVIMTWILKQLNSFNSNNYY